MRFGTRLVAPLTFVLSTVLSTPLFAQEAAVVGTVLDESKGVLPGATVTATDPATGRQFVTTATDAGTFRLPGLPAARYDVRAELAGFATSELKNMELLVGQIASVTFTLKVGAVAETVLVSAEAPLVDTQSTQVAGNVDRRQMEELPIQGRNWLSLTSLVKGMTANDVTANNPGVGQNWSGFQLNLDGQEITQGVYANFGQPGLSRDAIAEYQVVTNLFDVTMGRSNQIQIQAITKSGTNDLHGSSYGYFRSDKLNGPDAFTRKVLPYSNQQVGGTLGGPLLKDKLHYFAAYEYTREPNTIVVSPAPYGGQQVSFPTNTEVNSALGRVDYRWSDKDLLLARVSYSKRKVPVSLSSANYPTQGAKQQYLNYFATGNWSRVMSTSAMQELKIGFRHFHWEFHPMDGVAITPTYQFPGLVLGPTWNYALGERLGEQRFTMRYDLTWHKAGHDLKVGAEALIGADNGWWMARAHGQMFFSALPADAARRFPLSAWSDPSKWDFSGLDPLVLRYDQYYAKTGGQFEDHGDWSFNIPRPTYALWFGDLWAVNDRLTLNLGVRYDLPWSDINPPLVNATSIPINNGLFTEDVGIKNGIRDTKNIAPRLGFTWKPTDKSDLVIRGGTGLFYTVTGSAHVIDMQLWNGQRVIANSYPNDGRPGFIQDPTRGITATDVLSGKVPLGKQNVTVVSSAFQMPYTFQSMVGFQKQFGPVTGLAADLVYWKGSDEESQRDPNLFYDPTTGFNKNPSVYGRPNNAYGPIYYDESRGRSEYLALPMALTRRYANNFQLGMTYTLMFFNRDTNRRYSGYGAVQINPFDINADWGVANDFQRHTVRLNGVWRLPWAFSLGGFFSYGSGNPLQVTSGADPTGLGAAQRIRRDMTLIARNTFAGHARQSLDLRIAKEFRLAGNVRVEGTAELFNVYNYGAFRYNTLETSAAFRQPNASLGTPRTGQLGIRVSF